MDPETPTRKTMTKTVQAVYENGVLRPLEPVNLTENAKVTVTIANGFPPPGDEAWLDTEFHAACAAEADPSVTLEQVRAALAKIPGSMTEDFIAERDER
jgi:hypothetical protein